ADPKRLSQVVLGEWQPLDRVRNEEGVMIALPGGRLVVNGGKRGVDLVNCATPTNPYRMSTVPFAHDRIMVQTFHVPARKDASGRNLYEINGVHLHLGEDGGRWN